jgi:predicted DNA-binding transcriptional regulator AlpA
MDARKQFSLPETGFVRLSQIVGTPGDPEADPPKPAIPAIIPISKSTWWNGVRTGRFPAPVKLGPRTTCWRVEDIRALIANGLEKPDQVD